MVATIAFILILSFLVVIHELGHFFAAKWAKIKVEEFGLGYPPKAITLFTYLGTPFTLNWVPFGGFVRMLGEDASAEDVEQTNQAAKDSKPSKKKKIQKEVEPLEQPFYTKSAVQRLVVILAGVTVNFIFGVLAFSVVYSIMGIPTLINEARIELVAPNSPAAAAGLPTNVKIIEIVSDEVVPIQTNEDVKAEIDKQAGKTVKVVTSGSCQGLTCNEDRQTFEVYVRKSDEIPAGEGAVGIGFAQQVYLHYPWYEQLVRGAAVGVEQAVMFGFFILLSLGDLVKNLFSTGALPGEIAGPVGIVHQAQSQGLFNQGPIMILNFMALLSINLAIMNLLPIPALDGGRALFILLEKVVGKHRVQRVEGYANYGGFVLLIGLILAVTARDIWRIFF